MAPYGKGYKKKGKAYKHDFGWETFGHVKRKKKPMKYY